MHHLAHLHRNSVLHALHVSVDGGRHVQMPTVLEMQDLSMCGVSALVHPTHAPRTTGLGQT